MNEVKLILNKLLDKYEQSSHFSNMGQSNRRVLLKCGDKNFSEYNYQHVDIRDSFNAAIDMLVKNQIVFVEWLPGRKQLVAKEIWLNLKNLDRAYELAGRNALIDQIDMYILKTESLSAHISTTWIKDFLSKQLEILHVTNHLSGLYKKAPSHIDDVYKALEFYDQIDERGISMREFSIACYRNSKYFEKNILDDFLIIARGFFLPLSELLSDQTLGVKDQLAYLGIYSRPEIYEFAGSLTLLTSEGICDCSPLSKCGFAITSNSLQYINEIIIGNLARIMFIENKTNYDVYVEKYRNDDELVIYHGGFLSPQKKRFILKIISSAPNNINSSFWADIDLGGFKMFNHLKSLIPSLTPFKMGANEVKRYASLGLKRSNQYMQNLQNSILLPEYSAFTDVITELLHYGITIEQEIMLNEL